MEWKSDIEENVRSGLVELLILQLLCERDMYGYEIKQFLAQRTNNAYEMKEGSLYGPLYRMSYSINITRSSYFVNPFGTFVVIYGATAF